MKIVILESWTVVDQWWTGKPVRREFIEVEWEGSKIVFKRESPETVWRIVWNVGKK